MVWLFIQYSFGSCEERKHHNKENETTETSGDDDALDGKRVHVDAGCLSCHRPYTNVTTEFLCYVRGSRRFTGDRK